MALCRPGLGWPHRRCGCRSVLRAACNAQHTGRAERLDVPREVQARARDQLPLAAVLRVGRLELLVECSDGLLEVRDLRRELPYDGRRTGAAGGRSAGGPFSPCGVVMQAHTAAGTSGTHMLVGLTVGLRALHGAQHRTDVVLALLPGGARLHGGHAETERAEPLTVGRQRARLTRGRTVGLKASSGCCR